MHAIKTAITKTGRLRIMGWEIMMTYRVSLVVAATVMMSGAAAAAELPTFEVMGFPLTQHQAAALNSTIAQERTPDPALTLGGMPASPAQIAILSPRRNQQEIAAREAEPSRN
jgi:hypothetical protein